MKEGTQERDVEQIVFCRGFRKMLRLKDCNKEQCQYHFGVIEDPIYQTDKGIKTLIRTDRYVRCGVPKLEKVTTLCEVDK